MSTTRNVEIFSAGCPACEETIGLVNRVACGSCEITVLDMNQPSVAKRAKTLGVGCVPAVAIDGELTACCTGKKPNEVDLRAAGIGQAAE